MKNVLLPRLLLFVISFFMCSTLVSQERKVTSINSLWKFQKGESIPDKIAPDTSNWEIINLPHTWNDKDALDDGDRGYYRGKAWYYKKLRGHFSSEQKSYFLYFEGANQYTEVFVNGKKAGEHVGGYSAFTIDISPYLVDSGQNELLVLIDNSKNLDIPPLSADFTFFGGIYRDVFLIETAKVHFNLLDHGSKGIFITTPQIDLKNATVTVKGSIRNALKKSNKYQINYTVRNHSGEVVFDGKKSIKITKNDTITHFSIDNINIANPKLWSPDTPYLYQLEISIANKKQVLDDEIINFGVRNFSFDANKGFFLNGEPLKLIGANRHQDHPGMGNALSDDLHRSDLKLLKDMGANFVRLAHYPQDPAILEEADRIGLLVWEETPLVNEINPTTAHDDNSEKMLREMIRQHYNHPSIILWGYMNEIYWAHRFIDSTIVAKHTEATIALTKRLEQVARTEDPNRYTAMALHKYPLYEESDIDKIPQVVGWNLYHGWYYDTYKDFGTFMDEQHRKYPDRVHIISEFGAGSDPRFHSKKPERFDFTMEGHKRMMESYMKQIMERPYIAGATVWNLIDFSSERRIDPNPHINNKGILNADRTPKDVFFLFESILSKKPYLKIAETNWANRSSIVSDNTTESSLPVQVYANLDQIELFHNDKSLGIKKVTDHFAIWDVIFKEGTNNFKAKGVEKGKEYIDILPINYKGIPKIITNENYVDISINAGSNHSFYDDKGRNTWLPDHKYEKGSWGYLGGEPLYVAKKIGSKEDFLTINKLIGLYQTMRKNTSGYQFDVKDGWYEVELLFVEHFPKSRRFVGGAESPEHPGGLRVFDVDINNISILKGLDLLKDYGYNYPYRKKIRIKAKDGKGIHIQLKAIIGETLISGVRVRSL